MRKDLGSILGRLDFFFFYFFTFLPFLLFLEGEGACLLFRYLFTT